MNRSQFMHIPATKWPPGLRWVFFAALAGFPILVGQSIYIFLVNSPLYPRIALEGWYTLTGLCLSAAALFWAQRDRKMHFALTLGSACVLDLFVTGYWVSNHILRSFQRNHLSGETVLAWNLFVLSIVTAALYALVSWILALGLPEKAADRVPLSSGATRARGCEG